MTICSWNACSHTLRLHKCDSSVLALPRWNRLARLTVARRRVSELFYFSGQEPSCPPPPSRGCREGTGTTSHEEISVRTLQQKEQPAAVTPSFITTWPAPPGPFFPMFSFPLAVTSAGACWEEGWFLEVATGRPDNPPGSVHSTSPQWRRLELVLAARRKHHLICLGNETGQPQWLCFPHLHCLAVRGAPPQALRLQEESLLPASRYPRHQRRIQEIVYLVSTPTFFTCNEESFGESFLIN